MTSLKVLLEGNEIGQKFSKIYIEENRQRYTNKDQNGRKQLQENLLRKMDDSIKEGKKETQKKIKARQEKRKEGKEKKKWERLEGKGGVA